MVRKKLLCDLEAGIFSCEAEGESKMAASTVNTISPLKADNYPTWKLQCQIVLMKDALWGIGNGTEVALAEA